MFAVLASQIVLLLDNGLSHNPWVREISVADSTRRTLLGIPPVFCTSFLLPLKSSSATVSPWKVVTDPETYSALAYSPSKPQRQPPPLILFLHGAGVNDRDISNLSDYNGEHGELLPSLISTEKAPSLATQEFAVLAPYSYKKRSFYEEPRSRLLQFVDWASSRKGHEAGCPEFDQNQIFLFGFSDGATLSIELLTTRKFAGAVVCSYGFTGTLPDLALERIKGLPVWVFHCKEDRIFPVSCSDKLVASLRRVSFTPGNVKYSRFETDPEGFTGDTKGHTTGITASKDQEVYKWLLSLTS